MTEEQKTRIEDYVTTLNSNIATGDMLDLVIDTVGDRVLLYLNETAIDVKLERVIAQIVVDTYKYTEANAVGGSTQSIGSVTDNGQTVTYRIEPTRYLASAKDQELFSGFERLLSSYRRPHVIAS